MPNTERCDICQKEKCFQGCGKDHTFGGSEYVCRGHATQSKPSEGDKEATVAFGWLLLWANKSGVTTKEFMEKWELSFRDRLTQAIASTRAAGYNDGYANGQGDLMEAYKKGEKDGFKAGHLATVEAVRQARAVGVEKSQDPHRIAERIEAHARSVQSPFEK